MGQELIFIACATAGPAKPHSGREGLKLGVSFAKLSHEHAE